MTSPWTVKVMSQQLNRIESEYILQDFLITRPALQIISNGSSTPVKITDYSVDNGVMYCNGVDTHSILSEAVSVYFMHRGRKIGFESFIRLPDKHTVTMELPPVFFLPAEEAVPYYLRARFSACQFVMDFPSSGIESKTEWIEGDSEHQQTRYLALREKLGFSGPCVNVVHKVIEYLEKLRQPINRSSGSFDLPFVVWTDHRHIVLSVTSESTGSLCVGSIGECILNSKPRQVRLTGKIASVMKVSSSLSLIGISITEIQREDARFLFEQAYTSAYKG